MIANKGKLLLRLGSLALLLTAMLVTWQYALAGGSAWWCNSTLRFYAEHYGQVICEMGIPKFNNEDPDGDTHTCDYATGIAGTGSDYADIIDLAPVTFLNGFTGVEGIEVDGKGGPDTINGGESPNFLNGGDGNDTIVGGAGNDELDGGDDDDTINGGAGNDNIDGGAGNDNLNGEDGDDTLRGKGGADTLFGGPGNDKLAGGYGDHKMLNGKGGKAALLDGDGNDTLDGGPGDDTYLIESDGADTLSDESGDDTLDFSLAASAITIDLDLTDVDQEVDAGGNTVQLSGQFENFVGSSFDDVVFVDPLVVPRHLDGRDHQTGDTLNFDAQGAAVTDDGTAIIAEGFAPVTYINFETVNITNVATTTPTPTTTSTPTITFTPTPTPTSTPTITPTPTATATPYFQIYLPLILKRTETSASYWPFDGRVSRAQDGPRGWGWRH